MHSLHSPKHQPITSGGNCSHGRAFCMLNDFSQKTCKSRFASSGEGGRRSHNFQLILCLQGNLTTRLLIRWYLSTTVDAYRYYWFGWKVSSVSGKENIMLNPDRKEQQQQSYALLRKGPCSLSRPSSGAKSSARREGKLLFFWKTEPPSPTKRRHLWPGPGKWSSSKKKMHLRYLLLSSPLQHLAVPFTASYDVENLAVSYAILYHAAPSW